MTVIRTPGVKALLNEQMKIGRFASESAVIGTALHVFADKYRFDLAELDTMIQEGLADVERGDVYTEEEARAYLKAARAKL